METLLTLSLIATSLVFSPFRKSIYRRSVLLGILAGAFCCSAFAGEIRTLATTPGKINALSAAGGKISNVAVPAGITPFVDCVAYNAAANDLFIEFGYVSTLPNTDFIDISTDNQVFPGPANRGQTIFFNPGVNHSAWQTNLDLSTTPSLTWSVLGQTATASNDPALYCSSSSFTYQGRLTDGGKVANGTYDLQFTLFDGPTGGNQRGSMTQSGVNVTGGVFTVQLDFGAVVVPGLFLEIGAKHPGDPSFTILSPRQPMTATPFATLAGSVKSVGGQSADNVALATAYVLNGNLPNGGGNFIQNTTAQQTGSNFNISGNGTVGGNLTVTGTLNATLPSGSTSYIQNSTSQQTSSNFNISGNGTAGGSISAAQYNINGTKILSTGSSSGISLGSGAGTANSGNTFLGGKAGAAITTGGSNVFVGVNSGTANTGGANNVFIGSGAGKGNVTGTLNTAIGDQSGTVNTTGSSNTFVGANANATSAGLTNATAIGNGAMVSASNTMVLGSTGTAVQTGGTLTIGSVASSGGTTQICTDGSNLVTTCSNRFALTVDVPEPSIIIFFHSLNTLDVMITVYKSNGDGTWAQVGISASTMIVTLVDVNTAKVTLFQTGTYRILAWR